MFYIRCTLLYALSSIAIILMGKRGLVALLNLYFWCLVMVEWPFLAAPWGCLVFVIVVFPGHTHLLFLVDSLLTLRFFLRKPNILFPFFEFLVHMLIPGCVRLKLYTQVFRSQDMFL